MPLEAGDGFISGLVATNPVNATDQVAQGDDHIRLIKTAIKGSFPNVDGAVNFTPAQANILATDGDGAGMLADIAAIADPGADRILGWDESANAAIAYSLSTGLTTSGTSLLIDTAVVPRLNASNTHTGQVQKISHATPIFELYESDEDTDEKAWTLRASAGIFSLSTGSDAAETTAAANAMRIFRTGTVVSTFEMTATNFQFIGAVLTLNTSPSEFGFKGLPVASDETPVLTDTGKMILATGNVTIPANGSVAYPVGTVLAIYNTTAGDITIDVTTDTLRLAGTASTGTRTLAQKGLATLTKVLSTTWVAAGAGLS